MTNKPQNEFLTKPAMAVHSEQRELDIQKLCTAVLDTSPNILILPNGPYETSCPYCNAAIYRGGGGAIWASMHELNHELDCAYLIARDLSTNISNPTNQ